MALVYSHHSPALYATLKDLGRKFSGSALPSFDQTALFTFSDASECKRAITSIQTYVKDLSQQYSSYAPEEAAKIERAVIQQHGPHLFLCITNDYESAANILNKLG